jgi:glycerol uptake facilitator-like aquaporin
MKQLLGKSFAEMLGTAALLAVVAGSGIMGERLAGGNVALALLANSLATGFALYALISLFGPLSGAHFNPVVTLTEMLLGKLRWPQLAAYWAAQWSGAILGIWLAHLMFDLPVLQTSTHIRSSIGQFISEMVATTGLLVLIIGLSRHAAERIPAAVGAYIAAAYWFTASTSFANPAVTTARMLTDTFAGICPHDAPAFLLAQLLSVFVALGLARLLRSTGSSGAPDA